MTEHTPESRIDPESIYPPDFVELIYLTPAERFERTAELWEWYLACGGSLEPDPDPQSPFFDREAFREDAPHGRTGVRLIRRC